MCVRRGGVWGGVITAGQGRVVVMGHGRVLRCVIRSGVTVTEHWCAYLRLTCWGRTEAIWVCFMLRSGGASVSPPARNMGLLDEMDACCLLSLSLLWALGAWQVCGTVRCTAYNQGLVSHSPVFVYSWNDGKITMRQKDTVAMPVSILRWCRNVWCNLSVFTW